MRDLLVQQGLLKVLLGKKPTSVSEEDWIELDMKAVSTIRLCLAEKFVIMLLVITQRKNCDKGWKVST